MAESGGGGGGLGVKSNYSKSTELGHEIYQRTQNNYLLRILAQHKFGNEQLIVVCRFLYIISEIKRFPQKRFLRIKIFAGNRCTPIHSVMRLQISECNLHSCLTANQCRRASTSFSKIPKYKILINTSEGTHFLNITDALLQLLMLNSPEAKRQLV